MKFNNNKIIEATKTELREIYDLSPSSNDMSFEEWLALIALDNTVLTFSPTTVSCTVTNISEKPECTPPHSSWDDDDSYDRDEFRPDSDMYN